MKTTITLILISITITLFSQNEKIGGVGPFQINKTNISVINDMQKEMHTKVITITKYAEIYKIESDLNDHKSIIAEIKIDTNDFREVPSYAFAGNSLRNFFISKYTIVGIEFKAIYLTFKNDTLVFFRSDCNLKIEDAVKIKYGPARDSSASEDVNCVFVHNGNKITYKNQLFISWWNNNEIQAEIYLYSHYDDQCEVHTTWNFTIVDKIKRDEIYKESAAIEIRDWKRRKLMDKNKLSGF